jgi:hypothetical protein
MLRAFEGQEESAQQTATTDAEGRFRFENLETGSDWAYLVRVNYQDVQYSPGVLTFESGQDELSTQILIYESTTDAQEVRAERAHIFVTLEDGGLAVTELYVFANVTDRTYVGAQEIDGRRWTARFQLPQGSRDLVVDDGSIGGRFLATADGFVDTEPHWPGSTSVLYSYGIECRGGSCDLTRELQHPITNLNVLIPDAGATVESSELTLAGTQEAQGGVFLNYLGRDLEAGQTLDLSVRLGGTSSQPPTQSRSASALPWILLGTVLVALVVIYPFWRRRIEAKAREQQ